MQISEKENVESDLCCIILLVVVLFFSYNRLNASLYVYKVLKLSMRYIDFIDVIPAWNLKSCTQLAYSADARAWSAESELKNVEWKCKQKSYFSLSFLKFLG